MRLVSLRRRLVNRRLVRRDVEVLELVEADRAGRRRQQALRRHVAAQDKYESNS